jgi:hypothetical protein
MMNDGRDGNHLKPEDIVNFNILLLGLTHAIEWLQPAVRTARKNEVHPRVGPGANTLSRSSQTTLPRVGGVWGMKRYYPKVPVGP